VGEYTPHAVLQLALGAAAVLVNELGWAWGGLPYNNNNNNNQSL
jgi:hypothetical protein